MLENHDDFEALLEYLKQTRGFDFTAYKRTTLSRRVHKRIQMVHLESIRSYIDFLEVHPDEFTQLFNTILINITDFFRDPPVWDYLREEVLPAILARKLPGETIRVWSAGCSSGEEAYSVAILLSEALGPEAFRDRVKIYATDVDEEALEQARRAAYTAREVRNVPPELLQKYFEANGDDYVFDRELRRSIIFGRHDLIADAPISRVDLLLCRNAMMYFNAEVQDRILARFHFALSPGGFTVMGKAETLLTRTDLFAAVSLKNRVFAQTTPINMRENLQRMKPTAEGMVLPHMSGLLRLREAVFETSPIGHLVLDVSGRLVMANEHARNLFRLSLTDIGRPLQDLEISYRPVELRSLLEQAYDRGRPVSVSDVRWESAQREPIFLSVQVIPILENNAQGAIVTFTNITEHKRMQEELLHYNQELETAYEELQSTNEELQTTNEELQSTVEELETTNEELQSTNEELETINEEFQSTNEELETMNQELSQRTDESNRANVLLADILSSMRDGMVVVDRDIHVLAWNHQAEEMWGLRTDEVRGRHLMGLDIGLPVDQLRQPIRACLADGAECVEVELDAVNRRGRALRCIVTVTSLVGTEHLPSGAILQIEEIEPSHGDSSSELKFNRQTR